MIRTSSGRLPVSTRARGLARRRALRPARAVAFVAALLARYSGVTRHDPALALIFHRLWLVWPSGAAPRGAGPTPAPPERLRLDLGVRLSPTLIQQYLLRSPVATRLPAATPHPLVLVARAAAQPDRARPAAAPASAPVGWRPAPRLIIRAAPASRLTDRLAERGRRIDRVEAGAIGPREKTGQRTTLSPFGGRLAGDQPSSPLGEGGPSGATLSAPLAKVLHRPTLTAAVQPDAQPPRPPAAGLEPDPLTRPVGWPAAPGGTALTTPPIDLALLTDHVVRTIDQRMIAYRERTGRI